MKRGTFGGSQEGRAVFEKLDANSMALMELAAAAAPSPSAYTTAGKASDKSSAVIPVCISFFIIAPILITAYFHNLLFFIFYPKKQTSNHSQGAQGNDGYKTRGRKREEKGLTTE